MTEHNHQVKFIQWCKRNAEEYPELDLIYAIPNGGHRHIAVASKLKLEGVKAGVPDLCLPVSNGDFHSLYIEMKKSSKEQLSQKQKEWRKKLMNAHNCWKRANSWEEAIRIICGYLNITQHAVVK